MSNADERPANDPRKKHAARDKAAADEPADPTLQMPAVKPDAPASPDELEAPQAPPGPADAPGSSEPPRMEAPPGAAVTPDAGDDDIPETRPDPEPIMSAPRVAVVRLSGADDGDVTTVTGGDIIIGRLAGDLTVTLSRDQWVSRRHARITHRDGGWWLEDLGSSNGTYLGDDRTSVRAPTPLPLDVVFRVGHTDLMLTDKPEIISQGAINM